MSFCSPKIVRPSPHTLVVLLLLSGPRNLVAFLETTRCLPKNPSIALLNLGISELQKGISLQTVSYNTLP